MPSGVAAGWGTFCFRTLSFCSGVFGINIQLCLHLFFFFFSSSFTITVNSTSDILFSEKYWSMKFPLKQCQVNPAHQAMVYRGVIDGGNFWTPKRQRAPKPLLCSCKVWFQYEVGLQQVWGLLMGPGLLVGCGSWGIRGSKWLHLHQFSVSLHWDVLPRGLKAGKGWWCPFFMLIAYFFWIGTQVFLQKEVYFPNTSPFQKNKHNSISQLHNCDKSRLFSTFLR